MMEFTKATRETGVNGELDFSHPDFVMQRADIPAFDSEGAWYQLVEVSQAVRLARTDITMEEANRDLRNFIALGDKFRTPALKAIGIDTVRDGAMFVQMDDPWELFVGLYQYLGDQTGVVLNFRPEKGINFINGANNVWNEIGICAMRFALKQAFAFKWEMKVGRPENVVKAIFDGDLDCPDWVRKELEQNVFVEAVKRNPHKFTIYEEGCPKHPSYPAGHGTAAGATYALLVIIFGLMGKKALHDDIGQSCLSFAHCRTLAGVHFAQDNIEGFKLGAKAIRVGIVDLLKRAQLDEADIAKIAEASRDINTDWVK